ncbi:hypothetical protein SCLCIDRAFT_1211039 [Scleroderma citrinum Foug A]|uniref:Uncharacterized protein n=1 Tax=Scleroderma citrinum Foug A TaxID=1036808 RepID=A0A0C3EF62_9AGAM|nr:hypothetical protein SCLCIDRAFT_1211039 [Scleroderma citrinum Foug A]
MAIWSKIRCIRSRLYLPNYTKQYERQGETHKHHFKILDIVETLQPRKYRGIWGDGSRRARRKRSEQANEPRSCHNLPTQN